MNTTLTDSPDQGNITCNSWSSIANVLLNLIIIGLSLGKQFLNKKQQQTLLNGIQQLQGTQPTERITLNVPEHLRSSEIDPGSPV